MSRIVKYGLLGLVGLIVLVVFFGAWFAYKIHSETKIMTPLATGRVVGNVYAIQTDYVNFFVVKGADAAVVIDAGNDLEVAKQDFGKLGLDPQAVHAVFLTHTDADHIQAIKLFENAKVYISTEEEALLTGKAHKVPFVKYKLDAPYTLLNDGQELLVGSIRIKGILTPGHTPGSMCYLVDNKYLFTGDDLRLINGKAETFNDFFNMDTKTEARSINKLAKLKDVAWIFTAHYGAMDDFEKAFHERRH